MASATHGSQNPCMKRLALVLVGLALSACATSKNDDNAGGGGSVSGPATVTTDATSTSEMASSSTGGCAQDCSTVPVPACYESVCNLSTHSCDVKLAANGSDCDDGVFCTADEKCHNGTCEGGTPKVCETDNPCATATCDAETDACIEVGANDQTHCDTANICAIYGLCIGGTCYDVPKDCASLSDECNVGTCDAGTGECVGMPANDGNSCVGGSLCESGKTCGGGDCTGTAIPGCTLCSGVEPDGTIASANTDASCSSWGGTIAVVGDLDYYAIHVSVAGSRIDAEVNDLTGPGTCPLNFDSLIHLYDSTGALLATQDQGGVNSCSHLNASVTGATNLPVGDYFVEVEEYGNNATSPPYLLTLSTLPPGCGNGILEGAESCDGTAFGTATCASLGFANGTLACDASCNFVTSGCNPAGCGDGILENGEECDDGNANDADGCDSTCHVPACGAGQTRVFVEANVPTPIPDVSTITSTIAVPNAGTVQQFWIVTDITHTFDGDIDMYLTPPAVPQIEVSTDNGSLDDNYTSTIFGSNATTSITTGTAPFTGLFAPEGSFAPVIGTSVTGNWVLTVTDDAGGDIGTLNRWRVIACVN